MDAEHHHPRPTTNITQKARLPSRRIKTDHLDFIQLPPTYPLPKGDRPTLIHLTPPSKASTPHTPHPPPPPPQHTQTPACDSEAHDSISDPKAQRTSRETPPARTLRHCMGESAKLILYVHILKSSEGLL